MTVYYSLTEGGILNPLKTKSPARDILRQLRNFMVYKQGDESPLFRVVMQGKTIMAHSLVVGRMRYDAFGHRDIFFKRHVRQAYKYRVLKQPIPYT